MRIAEISVRRPVLATVISLLLVIFGLVALRQLPIREYPDVNRPVVTVSTRYVGASASVIETRVTQTIEDAVSGIEGMLKIDSSSVDERSEVRIEFDIDRNIDSATSDVRDRVSRIVAQLPEESNPPEILKADSNTDPVLYLAFNAPNMNALEASDYADRNLVDRFATVPGVARVSLMGARRPAMRIWIDRNALAARGLAVTDIEDSLRRENLQLPAGRLESQTREFTLRTEVGLNTPADFKQLVIARSVDGHLTTLGEVADVRLEAESERSLVRSNGRTAVGIAIEAQSKANTLDVVHGVRAEKDRLQDSLPPGSNLSVNVDNGVAIEAALREILIAVGFSFASVLLIIYCFLGSLRATLIPAVTIPVSIIAAGLVMFAFGYSINVLTLLGLVLAVGLVVDDAIVVLENIHRHVDMGKPVREAAVSGSREIGFAVLATTATLVAVFVPISFLPGDLGRLFREFGFTVAGAVLFSALVSLTLTPMMAARIEKDGVHTGSLAHRVDDAFRRLAARYAGLLGRVVRHPGRVLGAALLLVAGTGAVFLSLPNEFSPTADSGRVIVNFTAPEGTSFAAMDLKTAEVERAVMPELDSGDVQRIFTRLPANLGTSGDVNVARIVVVLRDWHERKRNSRQIIASLQKRLSDIPGLRYSFSAPGALGRRSFGRPVTVVVGGPDYEQLADWSRTLLQLASANRGLEFVDTDYKDRKPQIRISIDRNRAAELGVSLQSVGRALETLLASRIVTTYIDRGREYNVVLQLPGDARATATDLDRLAVRSSRTGQLVPLANITNLVETSGPLALTRFNRQRSITMSAGLAPGYSLGTALDWFERTVHRELPASATLMYDGESADFKRSSGQIYITILFALAIVYLVLAAQFESFVHPLVIITTVPLALIGAVLGLKAFGLSINIFSQIAVVILIGIAAKNGVLIVEFTNQLRSRGREFSAAIVEAAGARLRPVLMTSLCTAFGALPFVLASGAGAEQRRPIGVVVFFGTLIAVFLTLFVVPAAYALLARRTHATLDN